MYHLDTMHSVMDDSIMPIANPLKTDQHHAVKDIYSWTTTKVANFLEILC